MPNHCEKKKQCETKCKRFDSWCEAKSSCDVPKCKYYKRRVTLTEYKCVEDTCRRNCKKSGYKVRCEDSWTSISCPPPKVECEKQSVKKVCEKKKQCHRK